MTDMTTATPTKTETTETTEDEKRTATKTSARKARAAEREKKTETTKATKKAYRPGVWEWFTAGIPDRLALALVTIGVRLFGGLFSISVVTLTGFNLLPQLGMYTHRALVAGQDFNLDGLIAVWVTPLLFLVAMICVAEVALLRWVWRAGTRRIEKSQQLRAAGGDTDADVAGPVSSGTGSKNTSKKKRK